MTLRSYGSDEIYDAFQQGERIWVLDSAGAGLDDVLIGNDREEVMQSVIGSEKADVVADGWTLTEAGEKDYPLRSIIDDHEVSPDSTKIHLKAT